MASIFSSMDELEISAEEIQQAEVFAQQVLETRFPTIDFRQGTGVRDLVIRPNAMLLAMIKKYIEVYFDSATLDQVDNSTPNEVVDHLLSNYFLTRNTGSTATYRARLYFSFPENRPRNTDLPTSAYFSTDNVRKLYPITPWFIQPLPPGDDPVPGQHYFSYDEAEELWYVDTTLSSGSTNDDYNDLKDGDLLYFTLFSPYFIKGTLLYQETQAIPEEDNETFVSRSYNAISTRNLINEPSITSRLYDDFNFIQRIAVYGYGHPDQWRDYVNVNGVHNENTPDRDPETYWIHVGGCVDIYCQTRFQTHVVQYITDRNGMVEIDGPIFDIWRSPIPAGDAPDDIPVDEGYVFSIPSSTTYEGRRPVLPQKDNGLSARQKIRLEFGLTKPFKRVTMIQRQFGGIAEVQAHIESSDLRVVCADPLARSFEPILLNIEAESYLTIPADALSRARDAIDYYLNLRDIGGEIYLSDITQILADQELPGLVTPIRVSVTTIGKDLQKSESELTDRMGSTVTQRFFLDKLSITEAK